jgi:hypothetical protein
MNTKKIKNKQHNKKILWIHPCNLASNTQSDPKNKKNHAVNSHGNGAL